MYMNRLKTLKERFLPLGDFTELVQLVVDHSKTQPVPSKTWMTGVLQLSGHMVRQVGRDGFSGDDFESFVNVDWGKGK